MEKLEMIGIDVKTSIERFCDNKELYVKFLKKFIDDLTQENLEKAFQENNFKDVQLYAHTLKGVSGNLGMTKLYNLTSEINELCKKSEFEKVKPLLNEEITEYTCIINNIKEL